jgi:hypothetical protein
MVGKTISIPNSRLSKHQHKSFISQKTMWAFSYLRNGSVNFKVLKNNY